MVVPMTPTIGQPLAITTCPSTQSPAQKPHSRLGRSTSSERKDRAALWGARSARADIIDVGLVTGVGRSPPGNSSYPACPATRSDNEASPHKCIVRLLTQQRLFF